MRGLLFVLVMLLPLNAYAQIYQCTDKDGRVIFQPVACDENSQSSKKIDVDSLQAKQNRVTNEQRKVTILHRNLVKNSGFEKQLFDWSIKKDTHWETGTGFNKSGVLILQARKPPNDKYIHETVVSQCVQIENGIEFKLGARFRHKGRPVRQVANRVRVIWYDAPDCSKGGQYGWHAQPQDTQAWQDIQAAGLKPSLSASAAKIEIMQNGRYSNGARAYWDDVYLMATKLSDKPARVPGYELPAGFDFVENGDFRADITAWRNGWPAKWVGFTGHKGIGAAQVTASSAGGSAGRGALNQCVDFGRPQGFHVGASFKHGDTSTQKGSARLRITWYENRGCKGRGRTDSRWTDADEDMKSWQQLRLNGMQAPKGSTSARIEMIQSILGKGTYHAYWDDVFFKVSK